MDQTPNISGLDKEGVLSASEEAVNAPTLFEPRQRATYVRERIEEARRLRALGKNDVEIKAVMGSFVTEYPTLFEKAMSPTFNQAQLDMMLTMLDKMSKGMTQHQASVVVGQKLVDAYVKPMLDGRPTPKS
jgi:hypothetical protein